MAAEAGDLKVLHAPYYVCHDMHRTMYVMACALLCMPWHTPHSISAVQAMKKLLMNGADADTCTCTHTHAHAHAQAMKRLLMDGADTDGRRAFGLTALHAAAASPKELEALFSYVSMCLNHGRSLRCADCMDDCPV